MLLAALLRVPRLTIYPRFPGSCSWYKNNVKTAFDPHEPPPSLEETKVHAKGMRDIKMVGPYFKSYRRKKKLAREGDQVRHRLTALTCNCGALERRLVPIKPPYCTHDDIMLTARKHLDHTVEYRLTQMAKC